MVRLLKSHSCEGHVFNRKLPFPLCTIGVYRPPGAAAGGAGWPGQSTRFLYTTSGLQQYYCQTRSVHDTVVARLTPEDIKKAREAKQALVKPVKQKVGRRARSLG